MILSPQKINNYSTNHFQMGSRMLADSQFEPGMMKHVILNLLKEEEKKHKKDNLLWRIISNTKNPKIIKSKTNEG